MLGTLEALAIGTAGGLLFLIANLPGGLISGAMIAVGIAAIAGRPLAVPAIITQTMLQAAAAPLGLAAMLVCSLGAAVLLQLIKFPASWMFGAMLAAGILHGTGLVEGGLPPWMRGIALIGIGALIGSRFARMRVRTL